MTKAPRFAAEPSSSGALQRYRRRRCQGAGAPRLLALRTRIAYFRTDRPTRPRADLPSEAALSAKHPLSRRRFVSGLATPIGSLSLASDSELWGQAASAGATAAPAQPRAARVTAQGPLDEYDAFAKLASNENPWGPPDSVIQAMTKSFKYANRYGYPDGDILEAVAKHHAVEPANILLGAGSGELLNVVGLTFLQ